MNMINIIPECKTIAVSRMVTMSTGHISKETSEMLADTHCYLPLAVYNKADYGWFIYLPPEEDEDAEILQELPKDLALIFMFARHNEFDIVCLDSDGNSAYGLPKYEW